jgi:hypothetical protein
MDPEDAMQLLSELGEVRARLDRLRSGLSALLDANGLDHPLASMAVLATVSPKR